MRQLLKKATILMLALAIGIFTLQLVQCYLAGFDESGDDWLIDIILLPAIAGGSLAAARYILRGRDDRHR